MEEKERIPLKPASLISGYYFTGLIVVCLPMFAFAGDKLVPNNLINDDIHGSRVVFFFL